MPDHPEQHFRWTWELKSPPEALWPLVSNTDRFNRDCGYPPVSIVPPAIGTDTRGDAVLAQAGRRLRANVFGIEIEWDELAFEWLAPARFGVARTYHRGPIARMVMFCSLEPHAGGTRLTYDMRLKPASLLWRAALPFSIGRQARTTTERVFRRYDEFAQRGLRRSQLAPKPRLAAGAEARLAGIAHALVAEAAQPEALVAQLQAFLTTADDLSVARIRPYALADEWGASRRDTLHLCLHATRGGLLDFSWDLVCPHCRGAKVSQSTLGAVKPHAHCDSCQIDFTANFDQSVELTFTPNAAVRSVVRADYCVGGPQVTPHIVAQQRLGPGEQRAVKLAVGAGRYRVRTTALAEQHAFRLAASGASHARVDLGATSLAEPEIAIGGELLIANATAEPQLAIIERLAWSDQSTTAAEVTSLQLFRDLFSREVLRPGEQISVGAMTVVFTDLKNSTQLYQEIGDAPAFGRVLTHFEILKACVAAENGCIVKTMGDAIMAVFPRPLAAVQATLRAQRWLAAPESEKLDGIRVPPSSLKPLALKAGIHAGPCLAINQNERLDYFGTTVNTTARLCGLCTGADVVVSSAVRADAEVADFLAAPQNVVRATSERVTLKGFGNAAFEVWRIRADGAEDPSTKIQAPERLK